MNESQSGFSKPNLSTFRFFLSVHFLVRFYHRCGKISFL